MGKVFKFIILVNETDEVEVEIPQALHDEVCKKYVETAERFELGFHFFETMERDYPELHQMILQSIDAQLQLGGDKVYYSLCSNWFEDEA